MGNLAELRPDKFSIPALTISRGLQRGNRGGPSANWETRKVPVGARSSANYASAKPRYRAVTDVEQPTDISGRLASLTKRQGLCDLMLGQLGLPTKSNPIR
jgi:hypothetical protein